MDTLLIIAHGSSETEASASPPVAHARHLLNRTPFDDVRVAFVNGRPSIDSVVTSIEAGGVVVVPMFVSDGYISGTVVPEAVEAARRPSVSIRYAKPVGTHSAMTTVIGSRAKEAIAPAEGFDGGDRSTTTTFAVLGHGSTRSTSTRKSLHSHAARIERHTAFEEVRVFFLEEQPVVESLIDHIEGDRCVIVPVFIGDGYHVREDIPNRLGISTESRESWIPVDGRELWYTKPVGTHPLVARIVLERALGAEKTLEHDVQAIPREPPIQIDDDLSTILTGVWR